MFWCQLLSILTVLIIADAQKHFDQKTYLPPDYELRNYDQRAYACPQNFALLGNNCYYFSPSAATWHNAYFDCRDRNSELALVKKKWQDKLLRTHLKTAQIDWVDRWIGGIYDWKRMTWIWGSTGKPLRYRGFAKRVRKNLSSGNHQWKCISMNPKFRYRWEPKTCTKELHYVCETPPYDNLVTK